MKREPLLPEISVVIPTCNRPRQLAQCLERLLAGKQTLSSELYEIIVTDDGLESPAQNLVTAQYPGAKWVQGPSRGPAANRNNGARHARGKWIAFCDDDCLPDTQWLLAFRDAIRGEPNCGVFEGRTYVDRERRSLAEVAPSNESGGYLWSCNFLIARDLFEELGGFDERFRWAAMEDVELRTRIIRLGQRFVFVKDAAVCHPWRPNGGWPQLLRYRESLYVFLAIHPEKRRETARYHFEVVARYLLKETIPDAVRFRGRGLGWAMQQQVCTLWIAIELAIRSIHS